MKICFVSENGHSGKLLRFIPWKENLIKSNKILDENIIHN